MQPIASPEAVGFFGAVLVPARVAAGDGVMVRAEITLSVASYPLTHIRTIRVLLLESKSHRNLCSSWMLGSIKIYAWATHQGLEKTPYI